MTGTLLRSRADLAYAARTSPIRWTHLQHILESPAHYLDSFHDEEDTTEKRIGRIVDAYVLGGEDPVVFSGKRQGEAWERFRRFHSRREIVSVAENDAAKYAADAIEAHPIAMALLSGGSAHTEIAWQYKGRPCLSHPDYTAPARIVEVKLSHTVRPELFMALARRKGYPVQLGLYGIALGRPAERFIVAAQNRRPFAVSVFRLSGDAAEEAATALIDRVLVCERTDQWPAYTEGVVEFPAVGVTSAESEVVVEQVG